MLRIALVLVTTALVATPAGRQAAPAPTRPRITGIDHVAFRVADAPAARTFYGRLLGLAPAPTRTGAVRRGESGEAGATAMRFLVGHRQHIRVTADLPPGGEERLDHLAYSTPDVDALASHLLAKGVSVTRATCDGPVLRVRDPDGHTIEFVPAAWPPSAPASPQPASTPLSTRLLHAGLIVGDEAAATRFYGDVLGFAEIWRGGRSAETTDWVNMRVPDGTDYLEYMLVREPPDRQRRGVLHHVCLQVPDMQVAWEEVGRRTPADRRAALGSPNVGRNGRWQLNLYDAEGTRTELMEPSTVR